MYNLLSLSYGGEVIKQNRYSLRVKGFTIIELIVGIAIIGILVTISVVNYGSWRKSSIEAQLKSDLSGAAAAMEDYRTFNNVYPNEVPSTFAASQGVALSGGSEDNGKAYCIEAVSESDNTLVFYIVSAGVGGDVKAGLCSSRPIPPGVPQNLVAVSESSSKIKLTWGAVSGATSYTLQRATNAVFTDAIIVSTQSGTSSLSDSLNANTTYFYRVQASNNSGASGWSIVASAATSDPTCADSSKYGNYPDCYAYEAMPVGASISGYWSTAPDGYLLEDGSAISRTTYSELFALIGTTYGAGDGSTTFNLPDSRGRVAANKSSDAEFDTLGEKSGAKTHTLTIAQMPSHSHAQYVTANSGGSAIRNDFAADAPGGYYPQGIETGLAGGGQAHSNIQPSIVKQFAIKYRSPTGTVAALPAASSVDGYWSAAPDGYLLEDGSAVSRTTYADLFATIGTTYGAGNGSTTFNLPDSRGRVSVNKSSDAEFDMIGEKSGAKTHTLTIAQIPSHSHAQYVTANSGGPSIRIDYKSDSSGGVYYQGADTYAAGGNQAHNNIQPSIVKVSIIKYTPADESLLAQSVGTSVSGYWDQAPAGYLLEDGSAVSRTTYSELFALIGTTYGAGNGSTTFNLPDSRGRVSVNKSSDAEFDTIGEKSGAKTHTLTVAEMPSHGHGQVITALNNGSSARTDYSRDGNGGVYSQGINTGPTGGNQAHNNIQPSIVKVFAIKASTSP